MSRSIFCLSGKEKRFEKASKQNRAPARRSSRHRVLRERRTFGIRVFATGNRLVPILDGLRPVRGRQGKPFQPVRTGTGTRVREILVGRRYLRRLREIMVPRNAVTRFVIGSVRTVRSDFLPRGETRPRKFFGQPRTVSELPKAPGIVRFSGPHGPDTKNPPEKRRVFQ